MDGQWTGHSKLPSSNGLGHIGIATQFVTDGGRTALGAWAGPADDLQFIAATGQPVPGFPGGWSFIGFNNAPLVTSTGHAVLVAGATNGDNTVTGVWLWDGRTLQLRFTAGDPIVNLDSAHWEEFTNGRIDFAVNQHDQIVFIGVVETPDGDVISLLFSEPGRDLVSVIATGQPFEIRPDVVRTATGISVAGSNTRGSIFGQNGDDGQGTFLSDSGVMAFELEFADETSGIFVGSVTFPPCPADTNGDGMVTVTDLIAVILNWNCADPSGSCAGDVTADGVVNSDDFLAVLIAWGECP